MKKSRRDVLRILVGIGASGALPLAAACRMEEAASSDLEPCADVSALSDTELNVRQSLVYVPESPYPNARCDNCQFWLAPNQDTSCGGCVIVQGPIQAGGYCSSWAPPP